MELINTGREPFFEDVVNHMAAICSVPVAMVALAQSPRQWVNRPGQETGVEVKPDGFGSARAALADIAAVVEDLDPLAAFPGTGAADGVMVRAFICQPFSIEDKAAGWLYLADIEPRAWGEFEVSYLARSARLVGAHFGARAALAERDRRIELERELARAGALFQAIVSSMSEGVVVQAADGEVVSSNAAALEILGLTEAQLYGGFLQDDARRFLSAEGEPLSLSELPFARALSTGQAQAGVLIRVERPDGTVRWVEANSIPLRSDDGAAPYSVATTLADVTEWRAREEELKQARADAEAANASKSAFLANMSHEIRTPLNGVIGVAGALAVTGLNDQQADMVSLIRSSGETLERLLTDVLDMSKIEAGKFDLEIAPFDLREAVEAAAHVMRARADEKGVAFHVRYADCARGLFLGDGVRIRQIISNLTSNAVKFTEDGEVAICVDVEDDAAGGASTVVVSVRDTGVGFDEETKQRLFKRFEQADASVTRKYGGTGLGLSICAALADAMGGALTAASAPGRGSCFTLRLPLARAMALEDFDRCGSADDDAPASDVCDEALERPLRVLLAEDHPVNQQVVNLLLEPFGWDVAVVENGREALEAVVEGGFDIVLMDMQMPEMDGLAATRAIRAHERRLGLTRLPIVMLSANAMAEHVQTSLDSGCDVHVAKPVTLEALVGGMQRALTLASETEAARAAG